MSAPPNGERNLNGGSRGVLVVMIVLAVSIAAALGLIAHNLGKTSTKGQVGAAEAEAAKATRQLDKALEKLDRAQERSDRVLEVVGTLRDQNRRFRAFIRQQGFGPDLVLAAASPASLGGGLPSDREQAPANDQGGKKGDGSPPPQPPPQAPPTIQGCLQDRCVTIDGP